MNISIVTNELQDIVPAGGIGTASQHLAIWLKRLGFQPFLVFTQPKSIREKGIAYWREYYKNKYDLEFDIAEKISSHQMPQGDVVQKSWAVFEYFRSHPVSDVILFHDTGAAGFFCLKNKHILPCFEKSRLGIITHSPTYWIAEHNSVPLQSHEYSPMTDMERACIEMADFVLSPSHYLVDWMLNRGWKLPEAVYIIPYTLENIDNGWSVSPIEESVQIQFIEEIVFFGRLDTRKGIEIFLDALSLVPKHILAGRVLTLLGEYGYGHVTPEYIQIGLEKLRNVFKDVQHIPDKDALQARQYLKTHKCIAVMPSLGDNSPSVIYECIADRVPFLSSNMGGQPELIENIDHKACLFTPTAPLLAQKIEAFFTSPQYRIPRASYNLKIAVSRTKQFLMHEIDVASRQHPHIYPSDNSPLVSIALAITGDENINKSIKSIISQTYKNTELYILYTNNLNDTIFSEIFFHKNYFLIETDTTCIAQMYNIALSYIKGEFIIFMDDSISLYPEYIQSCLHIIRRDHSDAVTTGMNTRPVPEWNRDTMTYLSLGGGRPGSFYAFSSVNNILGAGAIFVSHSAAQSVAFTEVRGGRHEEWAFLLDLQLQGKKISAYPCPFQEVAPLPSALDWTTWRIQDFKSRAKVLEKHGKVAEMQLSELILFSIYAKKHRIWELEEKKRQLMEQQSAEYKNNPNEKSPFIAHTARSTGWRGFIEHYFPRSFRYFITRREAYYLKKSGLFSKEWYYNAYPDVLHKKHNAILHYILHGWREGRNPTATFNTNEYLNRNPDVRVAGINPFLHYILHGRSEHRSI